MKLKLITDQEVIKGALLDSADLLVRYDNRVYNLSLSPASLDLEADPQVFEPRLTRQGSETVWNVDLGTLAVYALISVDSDSKKASTPRIKKEKVLSARALKAAGLEITGPPNLDECVPLDQTGRTHEIPVSLEAQGLYPHLAEELASVQAEPVQAEPAFTSAFI